MAMRKTELHLDLLLCSLAAVSCLLAPAPNVLGQTLLLKDAFNPHWSPDGTSLVCNRPTPGYGDDEIQIWRVSSAGLDPDTLIKDPNGAFFPMWLPDGEHVVYHRVVDRAYEFVIHDLRGGQPVVWQVPDVWDDYGFSLSPDGSELLYTVWGQPSEIWALDLTNGSTRFIRAGAGGSISPDGQWLAFGTPDDSIAVEPVGGGTTRTFEFGMAPRWTPDSQYIVFLGMSTQGNPDLILRNRDGSYRRELTDDPAVEWFCEISPQGDKVAYGKCITDPFPLDLYVLDITYASVRETTWGQIKMLFK